MKNIQSQTTTKRTIIVGVIIAALVATAGLLYWYYLTSNRDMSASQQQAPDATTPQSTEPKEKESEGTSFPVPGDTPESAIKDYELVVENEQYKIRRNQGTNQYVITLYAIINNPDQYDSYKEQLKQYKGQALEYLKSKNLDPEALDITYEPQEAKDL